MHKSKVVEIKVLSDGELAVKVRCCDEETSASWVTIHNAHELDEAGIKAVIDAHTSAVELRHEKRNRAHAFLEALKK